jgi:hypothetical protein
MLTDKRAKGTDFPDLFMPNIAGKVRDLLKKWAVIYLSEVHRILKNFMISQVKRSC